MNKYDKGLAGIFAMETDKHSKETERFADKVIWVCTLIGVVLILTEWGMR